MAEPVDLNELAARVEALTGPDCRSDTLVHIAMNPDQPWIVDHEPGAFPRKPIYGVLADLWAWANDEQNSSPPEIGAPAYSRSLDAALSLAKGSGRAVADLLGEAMLRLHTLPLHLLSALEYQEYLARFVTAACLRALAAKGGVR